MSRGSFVFSEPAIRGRRVPRLRKRCVLNWRKRRVHVAFMPLWYFSLYRILIVRKDGITLYSYEGRWFIFSYSANINIKREQRLLNKRNYRIYESGQVDRVTRRPMALDVRFIGALKIFDRKILSLMKIVLLSLVENL